MHSPRVGVVRDSMLANPLIMASRGVSRSRGLSRPGPDFIYGYSNDVRDGGVAEADPDFVSLNRDGVKSGLVTAKELSQYRAQRVRTQQNPPRLPEHRPHRSPEAPPRRAADITFGITTRASSPLSELLSHQYARHWLDEQQAKNSTRSLQRPHKVAPAVDSFRNQEDRLQAFRSHRSDCVARRGAQGMGTYGLD
ncbi:cilia- and flagella-associated protein 77 [Diretmus argenteus]